MTHDGEGSHQWAVCKLSSEPIANKYHRTRAPCNKAKLKNARDLPRDLIPLSE
jgi:hypothetical protein